jgi:hypothetical protein
MTGFRFMQQLLEAATHAVARCLAVAYTKRLSTVQALSAMAKPPVSEMASFDYAGNMIFAFGSAEPSYYRQIAPSRSDLLFWSDSW